MNRPAGLPQSIGIGKGTVSLDDFDKTELVISIGHNPGTNHPRMMGTLHELARRGVPIIVFNPLKERALERFADPQNVMEMATYARQISPRPISGEGGRRRGGAEGIAKALLQLEEEQGNVLDRAFIDEHTQNFPAFAEMLRDPWQDIERESGLTRADLSGWRRLTPNRTPRSSPTVWASPSIIRAPQTCG
jgi:anaerobic selenocysteine-containing dehydrogenase